MAAISYPPIPIFELGPLNLSLHGLFAGLGFVGGAILMIREVRRRGFNVEGTTSVLTWALVRCCSIQPSTFGCRRVPP